MIDRLRAFVRGVSHLGTDRVSDAVEFEIIVVRNLTFALFALAAPFIVVPLLMIGIVGSAVVSGILGFSGVVGLLLSMQGRSRLGAFTAVLVCNLCCILGVVEHGVGGIEVVHIAAVTLPFTLFDARERPLMVGAVALAVAGVFVAKLPVWPAADPTADENSVRMLATVAVVMVVIGQLWIFAWARERTTAGLQQALGSTTVASEAKSAFVANMSHESRGAIEGVIDELDRLLEAPMAPEEREYATFARISAQSLLDIVDDVLDLSRLETSTLDIAKRAFDPRGLVDDVLGRATAEADPKGVELLVEVASEVPSAVVGDPDRVRQVLVNLVNNAVAFTREGHVRVCVAVAEREADRVTLELSVEDTGIGIPREAQAKVFETFEQVDASLTRTHEGAGLGLSICRGLVVAMEGELGMSSEPGRGSRFWFTLPVTVPERPASAR